MSSPSCTFNKWRSSKKGVTSSISQSWKGRLNWTSQNPPPSSTLSFSHKIKIAASLWDVILKRVGYTSFNLNPFAHLSHQNLVYLPFPIRIEILTLNSSHPFLMSFQRLIPKESFTPLVVHPSSISPNFPKMIFLHKLSHSKENLHNHFPSKAWLRPSNLIPNPPYFSSLHTSKQFTKWIFLLSPESPHKVFLNSR